MCISRYVLFLSLSYETSTHEDTSRQAMSAKRQFEKNEMKKKRASKKRKKDTTEDASEDSSEDGNETKKPANRGRKRRKPSTSR